MAHYKPGEAPPSKPGGIIMVTGMESVGKTWFGINSWDVSPRLFVANFDRGAGHLIKQYKGEGGVEYEEFTAVTRQQAESELVKLDQLKGLAQSSGSGVFIIDNASAWWDLVKMGKNKDTSGKPLPREFAEANLYARDFMLSLERSGLWCLLTAPPKELWSGARTSTGLFDAEGWRHQDFHIMAEIWLYTNRPLGAKPQPAGSGQMVGDMELPAQAEFNADGVLQRGYPTVEFKGQIQLAKKRPSVEGMIMRDPTLAKMLRAMKEIE